MKKTVIAAIAAGALVIAGTIGAATASTAPETVRAYSVMSDVQKTSTQPIAVDRVEAVETEPAPVVVEPAPAPEPPAAPQPVKCPGGTTAGAVDAAGNESNCQATNNGQPCVEYNDANQCVAWYKP